MDGQMIARLAWCEKTLMECLRRLAALEDKVAKLQQQKREIRSVQG